jgi:Flp pilus assembly protein TadG
MMRRPSPLIRDERGASIVEMALAAPILASLLIGMVDLSSAYSMKLQVVQAAQRTIEKVQVSNFQESDKTALQSEAATAAGVSTSAVTVDAWLECDGAKMAYTGSCTTGQTFARYVSVTIAKTYTPIFSMKFAGANADGTYTIRGRSGIRVQ